jgi:glycosyltransferase involved in cell wall biosynthesis
VSELASEPSVTVSELASEPSVAVSELALGGAATRVHVVLPNDIDDPLTPSGGNVYDRRICQGLAALGWSVCEHPVRGAWPRAGLTARANLARVLATLPDNAVVLLDGLVASAVPEVLVPLAGRLRLVVLVHLPLGEESGELRRQEFQALSVAAAVVTTSSWTRQRLNELYLLPADHVHVAAPGVDAAPLVRGSDAGSNLLCVAALTPGKGHDVLVAALSRAGETGWRCVCVGSLNRDPGFVAQVRGQARACGIADRVSFVGPRTGSDLDASYAGADLLVLASRGETYGMVVTEALARGIPVLATSVNGLPEALGRAPDGSLPGILVRSDDPAALADALRAWLGDAELRRQLRRSARDRRGTLAGWASTSNLISGVLSIATRVGVGR